MVETGKTPKPRRIGEPSFLHDLGLLLLLGGALVAALAFFLLADIREDHETALQTARVVEKQRAAMLAGAMEALVVVAQHVVSDVSEEAVQQLNAVAEAAPRGHGLVDGRIIKQVMVFDANGALSAASPLRQGAEGVDCSGCRAFRELKEGSHSLFGAYYGDIPGSAGPVGFAQRVNRPDGSFGGMVLAICDLGALVRADGSEDMSVVLLTADQRVVATYGTDPTAPGFAAPTFPRLAALPLDQGEVLDVSEGAVVAAVQRLHNYRLWVGVANSLQAVNRRAAEDLLIGLGLIGGVAVAVAFFCVAAGVQIRRRRLAERSLSRARDELEQRVHERTIELEREIQDRRQIEATLRTTELRFQRFMENTPTGAHIVDANGAFLYVNRRFAEWLGVAPGDAIGKTCRDLLPESLAVYWEQQDRRAVDEDGPVSQELTFTLNGVERVWLADKFPLRVEPGTQWLAGVTADVSAHRAAEQELHHAQRMEVLGQLTSGVTHDLNNLLTVMLGNLEIVEDLAADAPDIRQHVREAQWAARRAAHLTDRLLAMSRRRPPAAEVVDLNDVVEFMAELLRRTLGKEIDTAIVPAAAAAVVTVDVNRFENAVLNLCLNARDAMPQGGSLRVEVGVQTAFVSLSVADSGIGMPAEVAEHACDPFFTTKGLGKGTGLGLSMVKGFVGDSGGNLLIESEVARGTKVTLYFPRTDAEGAAGDGAVDAAAERAAALPTTVLVVEDEAEVRHLAVDALQRLGCGVREAEDAQAALAILETDGEVDLLFSDIVMPGGLSGVELAREVRRRSPQIRILLTSGFPGDAVDEDRDFWEFPVLRKPYDRQTLGRAVARRDGTTAEGCHDTDTAAAKV